MNKKSVLLDTSFFIRFLDEDDPLSGKAEQYFHYFLMNDINMQISTISIAEYLVRGHMDELPLKYLDVIPFGLKHAKKAGELAKCVFEHRNKLKLTSRNIIPNDTKLFAQADIEDNISYYISSDAESHKIFNLLREYRPLTFQFIELSMQSSLLV